LIHRDLKLENILLNIDKRVIKLIDFGFVRDLESIKQHKRANSDCGSPLYIAPEIWLRQGHDQRVDSWSFGIILYMMAFGFAPDFTNDCKDIPALRKKVTDFSKSGWTIEFCDREYVKKRVKEYVKKRVKKYMRNNDLQNNDQFWDLLNKLICPEGQRITVAEALKQPFFASHPLLLPEDGKQELPEETKSVAAGQS